MKSIAKCNMCGFVYEYNVPIHKIKCKSCGSNKSLSVRQGPDVLQLISRLTGMGSIMFFRNWNLVA